MRQVPNYEIHFFWEDETPIDNVKESFTQIQVNKFLVHNTIEHLKLLPKERREALYYEIIKKDLNNNLLNLSKYKE